MNIVTQAIAILMTGALVSSVGCRRESDHAADNLGTWYKDERTLYYGIPVRVSFSPSETDLADRVWEYLERVDEVFNDYKETTEVGRINTASGPQSFKLSNDLAEAIRLSIELNGLTDGAFDVTLGPLRRFWRAAETQNRLPEESEVAAVLRKCGLDKVRLDGNDLSMTEPGIKFDFGGIIKGIAVDNAIEMLKRSGVNSGMIQIGGETAAFGESSRGKPHILGIQNPIHLDDLWDRVPDQGNGLSISTSGNYWNPIVINDVEYYHILNPKTGWPVDTRILSVSVVFPATGKNWLADGLTTAGTVIETKRFLSIVESHGGEALVISLTDGHPDEYATKGWDRLTE